MNKIKTNLTFLLFFIFTSNIISINSLVVIPFKINIFQEKKGDSNNNNNYNSTTFVNEYFYRDMYTNLKTGIPSKDVLAILDTRSHIFQFEKNYLSKSSLSEIVDPNNLISKDTYDSSHSHSFKKISPYEYSLRELKNATICSETFLLFKDLLLETTVPFSDVKFLIDDNIGNGLNIRVGLSTPMTKSYQGPPHLFQSLLDVGAITDQSWTIKFLSKNEGIFVLGDEPHRYQDITKDNRYQRKYYFKTDSLTGNEYYNPISIPAKKVYLHNKKGEEIILSENKGCYLNYNYGFILGTGDYRDYIKKNFFDELINLKICSYDLVFFNDTDGITNSYYTISCDKNTFKKYHQKFPSLYFFVYDYNYNFELTKEDLFTIVNDKYYFLILFEKKIFDHENLAFWSLGLPFLEKYEFVHNYEKNNIGFYKHIKNLK